MKVTKQSLKKLIKECLVEILAEDFIDNLVEKKLVESAQHGQQQQRAQPRQKKTAPDLSRDFLQNIKHGQEAKPIKTDITDNPVINEMLADTAKTTLPQMLSEERKMNPTMPPMSSGDSGGYEEIPDGDSRWAQVAFAPPKRPGY